MSTQFPFGSALIFGLGLVGASICLGIKKRAPGTVVTAVELPHVAQDPKAAELVDALLSNERARVVDRAVSEAEVVILAAPVSAIEALLPRVLRLANLVTDCGSTKRTIVGTALGSERSHRFVPGHPMAGGPRGGYQEADADLFVGRTWILCGDCGEPEATAQIEAMVRSLGARAARLDAAEHDSAVALTSHVPQLLASALVAMAGPRDADVAAGPSYLGTTRAAGGNEAMWRDIFRSNADEIARVTKKMGDRLLQISSDLENADVTSAMRLLEEARARLK